MRKLLEVLLCIVVAGLVTYIGGAIYASSWDPMTWTNSIKTEVISGTVFGAFVLYWFVID